MVPLLASGRWASRGRTDLRPARSRGNIRLVGGDELPNHKPQPASPDGCDAYRGEAEKQVPAETPEAGVADYACGARAGLAFVLLPHELKSSCDSSFASSLLWIKC